MTTDFAAMSGLKKKADGSIDFAGAAFGGQKAPQQFAGQIDQAAYQRAIAKRKAGQPLSTIEARAYTAMQASLKAISGAGVALQPFQAAGDITRGVISDVQADLATGQPFTHTEGGNRGMAAAVGHFTYGASERLPGQAGARANGVTGEDLLKGTKWAGNPKAGLWAEILTDPTIVFTGIGALGKGVTLTAKLAGIEKLASTAAGRATINKALAAASKASGQALHLGDELTGLPTITRVVTAPKPTLGRIVAAVAPKKGADVAADLTQGGVAGVAKGGLSRLGDTTMSPGFQSALGVRTYADAFFTPDVKAAVFTPEQLARDHFRDAQRIASGDLGHAITTATVKDAGAIKNLTAGLKPADAKEVNRLLGVVTTATDPAVIAEVSRKLGIISTRYGRDLEKPFVSAVKAADNFSQNTIGRNLQAQGLPVILDPAVTAAVQKAQTLSDLTPLIGKYANDAGRPRGILMTQYAGRDNPDRVIAEINKADPTPASVTLNEPKIAQTVDNAVATVEIPPAPMQPTGTAARTAPLPANTAEVASDVTASTPDQVMADLFGAGRDTPPPLKPFEPEAFNGAELTYRGERRPGEYAGLNPQLAGPEDAASLRIAQEHSDLLYTTPDRGMAEGFADPMLPTDTPVVREVKIAPTKTLDLSDVAPSGTAASMKQVEDVLTKLGVPAEQWPKVKDLWGATPDWEKALAQGGIREAGKRYIYDLFRDEPTGIVKAAVRSTGADAVRFGPEGSREVIVLDRSRAAEVTPQGLKPTSPDVVPYNVAPARSPDQVMADLFSSEPAPVRPVPEATPPASVSDAAAVPPSPVNSPADLRAGLGNMGSGISDSMYDALHGKYLAGDVTEGGQTSALLQGAAVLKSAGVDLTREQFPDFAQQFTRKLAEVKGAPDRTAQLRSFLDEYAPPAPKAATPPTPAPATTPSQALAELFSPEAAAGKTPTSVAQDVIATPATDPYIQAPAFPRTAQDVSKDVGLHVAPPERIVTKTVPTTYRTVQVDSSAVDWASLPDRAARTEVQRAIGNGFKLTQDARGRYVPNKAAVTLPLDHPVVGRYFPDDAIEGARFGGDSAYGELTQATRQQVPDWFNPKDPAPLSVQRATRDAELAGREAASYSNNFAQQLRNMEGLGTVDPYFDGYALAFAGKPPATATELTGAANDYARRVAAIHGAPPTPAEVFRYRMQMARVQQSKRLQNLSGSDVTDHLKTYFAANPEATLYEATLSAAQQFGVGTQGARLMRKVLQDEESGFLRQLSSLEKKEFAGYIRGRDQLVKGGGGGGLTGRLIRNPEAVSEMFKQVFPQEENALKLLTEQAKTRTGAILKADNLRAYHDYLTQSGQHLTERQLIALQHRPISQLTAEERVLRESIASGHSQAGTPAGWTILENSSGPFQKGDAVPWWAKADLFASGAIDDAAVSSRILQKGGVDFFNRFWKTMNAQMLSSPSSIINDQIGMFQQMILWGIQPEEIVHGMIRRLGAAATPQGRATLAAMRENGIASAKLESNLGVERTVLEGLARRLEGETDLNWFQRIADGFLNWREYGTAVDRGALSNPVAKISSNVLHAGGGYMFQLRSAMSDFQRESLYMHYLNVGNSPKAAAAAANETLMDMRLAPAYSKLVSKYWPFFRWISMSAPRGVLTAFRRPALSHAYQNIASLSDTATEDGKNDIRRELARDGGYVNLGFEERDHTRLYIDPRNWDVENTIPQMTNWTGTQVGPVGLPWYASLISGVGWGLDRNGNNIYSPVLGTADGGFKAAMAANPKQTLALAAKYTYGMFNPSFAPGSSRAQQLAASIVEASKLPNDGSKDLVIAHTLMSTPWGQATIRYMQQGNVGILTGQPLTGNRGSNYSTSTPSMAAAGLNFLFPIRRVNATLSTQGDARAQVSIAKLELATFKAQTKKQIMMMRANPATTPAALQAKIAELRLGVNRRNSDIKRLADQTR